MSTTVTENRISSNGAIAPVTPTKLVVHDDSPVSYIMDTARFEHTNRIAKMMAFCEFMPDHLVKDKSKNPLPEPRAIANCMLVLGQAMRWNFDPYSVAGETYVVSGKLSYQGKLIAAVVNARAGLKRSLDVVYSNGKGDDLAAVIYGSRKDIPKEAKDFLKAYVNKEDNDALLELKFMDIMAIRVTVGQCKTNNQMWQKDPAQKLFYTGSTKWARRFCPELMLGVITDEDIERMSHQGPAQVEPGTSPKTLDELNKAMESAATVKPQEPTPETEVKQEEVIEHKPPADKPEWVQTILNRIAAASRMSVLEPIGDELLTEYRHPETNEADKAEWFPLLFAEWTVAAGKTVKNADKPRLLAKVQSWGVHLPEALHEPMVSVLS